VVLAAATGVIIAAATEGSSSSPGKNDGTGSKQTAAPTSDRSIGGHKVRNATPQPDWRPSTGPVPILEYHVLGSAPAGAPYPELYVSRPDFHQQMDWLDGHGYQAVTLEEVEDAWYDGGTLPAKPVVVSFDDG
jgi:hypothetical protein